MKARIILIIGSLLLNYGNVISKESAREDKSGQKGEITLCASPELYPLTATWVSEYVRLNPEMKIQVRKSESKQIADMVKSGSGIGFVTEESVGSPDSNQAWSMIVGRNVVVPVMNVSNPVRDEICRNGITSADLVRLFQNSGKPGWEILLNKNNSAIPLHYYYINDPQVISGVAGFTKMSQYKPEGIEVPNEQALITAIQKDPNAFGFCRLIRIVNPLNQSLAEQIQLVPIDKNGNGKIDYMEAIFTNLQEFTRGVWIGKYPKELSANIYFVSRGRPESEAELAFLNWVLTEGQKQLNANGYSGLVVNERQTQLAKINEPVNYPQAPESVFARLKGLLFSLIALIAVAILADILVRRSKSAKKIHTPKFASIPGIFDENTVIIPKGIYFDKTHTWAFMKKDGLVKVGIDDFLLHITGPLTRIEMKKTGDRIKKGEHLLTLLQHGKQLNIYSPVTGTIKMQNHNLLNDTTLLNTDPFTDGWIYTVEPTNWLLEIQFLNMAEKYTNWLKTEYTRLKDFFAAATRVHVPAFVMVLQDGGVLRDGILGDLGPEVWEDFQTKFIDTSKTMNHSIIHKI